jgi:hypothetical protein
VLKNYSRPVILLSLLEKLYATLRRGELLHGHALLRVVKNTGQVGTLLELVIAIEAVIAWSAPQPFHQEATPFVTKALRGLFGED